MKAFVKPREKSAGSDQIDAMEESVNTQLEQMFGQVAKRNALDCGCGRTTMNFGGVDNILRLDTELG